MVIFCIEKRESLIYIKRDGESEETVSSEDELVDFINNLDKKKNYKFLIKRGSFFKDFEFTIFKNKQELTIVYLDDRIYEIVRSLV